MPKLNARTLPCRGGSPKGRERMRADKAATVRKAVKTRSSGSKRSIDPRTRCTCVAAMEKTTIARRGKEFCVSAG